MFKFNVSNKRYKNVCKSRYNIYDTNDIGRYNTVIAESIDKTV